MSIWLNGPFGGGKTTTAAALRPLIPASRLFDPETVGYMLQGNLADRPVSDFQHWPPWRPLVVATAREIARYTGQHLIAPQTVLTRDYLDQIFAGLRAAGLAVFQLVLDADEAVLRRRIHGSDEGREWRLANLPGYLTARSWMVPAADLVVHAGAATPAEAARQIAAALPELPGALSGMG
jgi:hypothetical protein